jgi:hypothetical protein
MEETRPEHSRLSDTNKKVGSRPLSPSTLIELTQYSFFDAGNAIPTPPRHFKLLSAQTFGTNPILPVSQQ